MEKKTNSSYCTFIEKGIFVSHRGTGFCCVSGWRQKDVLPSEFWHGNVRKDEMSKMEAQKKVRGCDTCYISEKNRVPSNRIRANSYLNLETKKNPTIIDLDLSNFCNLKCVMCDSSRSSQWAKHEGRGVSSVDRSVIDDVLKISGSVELLTLQGGEPSLMREYEYYFDGLDDMGVIGNVDLQVITNATNINTRFYSLLKKFKSVRLSVSVDAYGSANDYVRWPSKFSQITKNVKKIAELEGNISVDILNTINMLSMFNYGHFLQWAKDMESHYQTKGKVFKVVPMKIHNPEEYSPFNAPTPLKEKFVNDVENFMKNVHTFPNSSNWKTEMMLISKLLYRTTPKKAVLDRLMSTIHELNSQRNITNISDFLPNFEYYFKKT